MSRWLFNVVFRSLGGGQESRSDRDGVSKLCSANHVLDHGVGTVHCNGVSFNCARYRDRIVGRQTVR